MHKSKRVHFSKLPNVRAFCFIRLSGRGICCAALQIRCYPQRPSGRFLHCPSPQRHDVLRCSAQKRRCLRRCSGQVRLAHLPPQAGGAVRRGKDQVPVKGILAGGVQLHRQSVRRSWCGRGKVVGADAPRRCRFPAPRRQGEGAHPSQSGARCGHPRGCRTECSCSRSAVQRWCSAGLQTPLWCRRCAALPAIHHDHIPAQAVGFVTVVGDQQRRAAKPGQQAAHFALHFFAQVAVQRTEGSSSIRILGLPTRMRASAVRCCCPPESWAG